MIAAKEDDLTSEFEGGEKFKRSGDIRTFINIITEEDQGVVLGEGELIEQELKLALETMHVAYDKSGHF